jgi:hypothetical protein
MRFGRYARRRVLRSLFRHARRARRPCADRSANARNADRDAPGEFVPQSVPHEAEGHGQKL